MYVYCVHADLEHDKFVFASIGMTWIQEIVYLVQTLDFEGSRSIDCDERIPYLEFPTSSLTDLSEKPSPRIIKTHLPLKLLPTQIQTIQPKVRGLNNMLIDRAIVTMKHYQNNMLSERVFSLVYLFYMYMQVEQLEHKKQ